MKYILTIILLIVLGIIGYSIWNKNSSPALIATVKYQCDEDKTITADFYKGSDKIETKDNGMPIPTGSAKVNLSDGRVFNLMQTVSADGVRYSNGDPSVKGDETFVFWSKGNGAFILENNEENSYTGCVEEGKEGSSTLVTAHLNPDVYPLYDGITWDKETPATFETFTGYTAVSTSVKDTDDISAVSKPFLNYYANSLDELGWIEDNTLAAGGPGSSITAYKKGDDYIILGVSTDFKGGAKEEPVQCPCDVSLSVFTGKVVE